MNKRYVFLAKLVATLLHMLMLTSAHAADTTITITANIKASPCTAPATMSIEHGDFYVNNFNSPYKNNALTLTACPDGTSGVTATFDGEVDSTNSEYYKNTGTAKGIALQLVQSNTSKSLANGKSITFNVGDNNTATLNMASRLVITDATKLAVGTVLAIVNVTFSYS